MKNDATLAWLNVRLEKKRIGSIGSRARSSQRTKAATSSSPITREATISGLVQPWPLPRTRPQTTPSRPALTNARPRRSRLGRGPASLVQAPPGKRHQGQPDGHVDPEDPLPRQAFDHGAADERPEGDGEAADAAPGAQREAAALGRYRRAEDGQGERSDDGAAEALEGAGGDESLDRWRQGSQRGREREESQADHEHPPAPEAITERSACQEEDRERERVRVDRPLELLDRRAEVGADHGQRRRDDEVVERDHDERDRRDHERPEGSVSYAVYHRASL